MSIVSREYFQNIQVPFIEQDEEILIAGNVIARALEYADPSKSENVLFSRHKEELEPFVRYIKLISPSGEQETRCYTERGVYHFCMLSRTNRASQFRNWISKTLQIVRTKELRFIQDIDKTPIGALELVAKELNMMVDHLKIQDRRIQELEFASRTFAIDRHQAAEIKRQIAQLAFMIADIEEKEKPDRTTFIKLWTNFNDYFKIPSYKDLPKAQYSEALELLGAWRERFNQELEIT